MQISTNQRVFIVTTYLQTGSSQQGLDQFDQYFPQITSPLNPTIKNSTSNKQTDSKVIILRVLIKVI